MRRALNDTALLLRNSADVHEGHDIERRRAGRPSSGTRPTKGRSSRSSGTSRPTACARCRAAGVLRLIGARRAGVGRRRHHGARRRHRHPARGARRRCSSRSTARFAKGSGLGLAIVHRIVSDYNGEIQVSSQPGAGTTVSVRLPARAAVASLNTPIAGAGRRGHRRAGRRASWSSTMSGRCGSCWRSCCGAKATKCCSPRTAARDRPARARAGRPPDLGHQDARLSGVDVLRAAKQIDQDILGIMITAFASTETAVEAMRLGACDYLSKPFDIDLLKMKVREKIENRQLRQENVLLKRTLGPVAPVLEHHRPQRGDARRLQDDRDGGAHQQHDPADRRIGHRQGAGGAGDPLPLAAARQADGRRSTAARCRRTCSSPSCSATCAAPSPAPTATRRGCSRSPSGARSSSTRSAR